MKISVYLQPKQTSRKYPQEAKTIIEKKNKNKTLDHKKEPSWAHQPRPQSIIHFYISMWRSSSLMPQCCNYQFSLWRMVPNPDRNSQISACFSLIIIFQCLKKTTFLILSLPQEPGHTLLWFLSYSYSSLIFLDVLLQRSWPHSDTWSILRVAPLNINSFYLPPVERQHSEVEFAYNIKENPLGFGILLSRVSSRTWSKELTVLQTYTHSAA